MAYLCLLWRPSLNRSQRFAFQDLLQVFDTLLYRLVPMERLPKMFPDTPESDMCVMSSSMSEFGYERLPMHEMSNRKALALLPALYLVEKLSASQPNHIA